MVLTTKYRRKLFDDAMIGQLREAFESACVKLECDLLEMNSEANHAHLLIAFHAEAGRQHNGQITLNLFRLAC